MQLELTTVNLHDNYDETKLSIKNDLGDVEDLKKIATSILKISMLPANHKKRSKISQSDALRIVKQTKKIHEERNYQLKDLETIRKQILILKDCLTHFKAFDFNLSKINKFKFVSYKFGYMPLNNYKQYKSFLFEDKDIFLLRSETEGNNVWCVYFTHNKSKNRVDQTFESLNFKEIIIPHKIDNLVMSGSVNKMINLLQNRLIRVDSRIKKIQISLQKKINNEKIMAAQKVMNMVDNFNIMEFGKSIEKDFFIFSGWITGNDFEKLHAEIENDKHVIMVTENHNNEMPPVSLFNNNLFKPFEFLVRLYGIPSYYEIDPTPFLAITYTFLFGLMFGDVGHGFILFIVGLLDKIKRNKNSNPLLGIMMFLGASSMVFGLLYGSVFGFEDIIKPLWLRPSDNIDFILIFTVAAGIFLILLSMIFNLINCKRTRDFVDMIFSTNGFCGLLFYVFCLLLAFIKIMKIDCSFVFLLYIVIAVSLFCITFSDLIKKIIYREKKIFGPNIFLFIFETVINLFENLLSYFTNTVSFVRVGAFALSHAGMMSVVMLLSKSESGHYNWLVVVLGNIFVIALEGLIVGIQALRLEFYEMFGRFFRATGREYIPTRKTI
jgi:V/A-type H+-transporting ATPase subunit I